MHRFFANPSVSDCNRFFLNNEDVFHAVRVLRLHPGDQAEIMFSGNRYLSQINQISSDNVSLVPIKLLPSTEPSLSITLFQGLPKSDKMDFIIQKSVELGAVKIVPVIFSRSVIRLNDKDAEKKRDRWQKIACEAGKQSGRCIIPEISPVCPVSNLNTHFSLCDKIVVPWEECVEGGPLSFCRNNPGLSSLGIVIGPEGGISADEMNGFLKYGCEAITLGKRILRTETAGLASMSVFFGLYGEME